MHQWFKIVGTGSKLPGEPVSAADVESRHGLPVGWIAEHTQVADRTICEPPHTLVSMATSAIDHALNDAKLTLRDIDLIIDSSTSRSQPIPCNGALLSKALGPDAAGLPSFDVHGTCLGFLLGMNVANSLLATEQHQRILLVCSEAPLAAANWNDPESATLLADGAAAVVLRRSTNSLTGAFGQETYAGMFDMCAVRGGGHTLPAFTYHAENDADYRFHMNGPQLLKAALKYLPPLVNRLIEQSGVDRRQLLVVPHQASPRALSIIQRKLGFSDQQFINRAASLGNMASASIPVLLDQLRREQKLSPHQPVLLLGTSAGYSQAGMIAWL